MFIFIEKVTINLSSNILRQFTFLPSISCPASASEFNIFGSLDMSVSNTRVGGYLALQFYTETS